MDTGDAEQDTVLTCGTDYEFYWAGSKTTGEFSKHDAKDEIHVTFGAAPDCMMSLTVKSAAYITAMSSAVMASALVYMSI